MGGAIARGLAKGNLFKPSDIICTTKTEESLKRIRASNLGFSLTLNNETAARRADFVVIAVKPWLVEEVLRFIAPAFNQGRKMLISVAAGVTLDMLYNFMHHKSCATFRAIPNTAAEVQSSMTLISERYSSTRETNWAVRIFNELGHTMLVEERLMEAGTTLASCGIAFALRYIRASVEGGVELGFRPKDAQEIVAHTVKGAIDLLLENKSNPEIEIDKITTPGGITIKGLNEMELSGFTSTIIRGLRACK